MSESSDTPEPRELTADELDVEGGVLRFWLAMGGAWMALEMGRRELKGYDRQQWARDGVAFGKALGALARENQGRFRVLWAQALQEPLPFGMPPVGMPRKETKP